MNECAQTVLRAGQGPISVLLVAKGTSRALASAVGLSDSVCGFRDCLPASRRLSRGWSWGQVGATRSGFLNLLCSSVTVLMSKKVYLPGMETQIVGMSIVSPCDSLFSQVREQFLSVEESGVWLHLLRCVCEGVVLLTPARPGAVHT